MLHLLTASQSIIEAIPNPIFAKYRSHQIILLNASACEFFGHSREALPSQSDFELFPAEQVRIFHAADDRVFETDEESENEEQSTVGTGHIRHVIASRRNEEGRVIVRAILGLAKGVGLTTTPKAWKALSN